MKTDVYHKTLTGKDYLRQLHKDIEECELLRFCIAFISPNGIEVIGMEKIAEALKNEGSFGLTSLACIFSHEHLIELQDLAGGQETEKLKVFFNLAKIPKDEPLLSLLHSKIIYLVLPTENEKYKKSIVYIGSHNWTQYALCGKNEEASIRFEFDYEPSHVTGEGTSIPAEINHHLLIAKGLISPMPAFERNKPFFEDWRRKKCGRGGTGGGNGGENGDDGSTRMEEIILLIAVGDDTFTESSLPKLKTNPLYLQVYSNYQEEGKLFHSIEQPVWILAWANQDSLHNGNPPMLFTGKCSTIIDKAGGHNITEEGVKGFFWYMSDKEDEDYPQKLLLKDGTELQYWSLSYNSALLSSSDVDKKEKKISFQFMIEVEGIIPHKDQTGLFDTFADTRWAYGELALAESGRLRYQKEDGLAVGEYGLSADEIIKEYRDVFGIDKLYPKVIDRYIKKSAGIRLTNSTVNKFLSPNKERVKESDWYDEMKKKQIKTAIDFRCIDQEWKTTKKITKRTQLLHHEDVSHIIERLKRYRDSA
jgi:hypothetical protein